uniref:Uncharacterized protein n=1 Tax=Pseudo-nitzschia australis TaxID=44445 RepID=A0A7S4EGE6_9STRA|mmetsp:Transcript_794/g.1819  ORF Transcript_794/g.1819 Transcript_794/m.1819 type:complete len:211 (-) Transcript_794:261-893(-)|eukprot:CAMPEP_0168192666 /NCGR_PEP_ID=MMETSP0139_2-20121125/18174_1 /TAXON_ID=44445 /ORGANISM="Pseudo-nitzschia australis, Strain 10249 10 AB" /LENGTH=210 /DNA_ID=CAMNT_0008115929 /DNA_START=394 /DNA_END=1026 /DNA_ORIENTATION=-
MSSLQQALAQAKKGDSGGINHSKENTKIFTPTIRTVDSSSSDDDDASCYSSSDDDTSVESKIKQQQQRESIRQRESGDMMKIRQQAVDLINKRTSAGPNDPIYASYQSASPYVKHNPDEYPKARVAEDLSVKDMFVNCVSEVCKSSSSEILHKVLSAGYKSVSNYGDQPINGEWGDSIDTSQHGYGNGNKSVGSGHGSSSLGNMHSRYQD